MAALLLDTEKLAVSMARSIEDFTYYTVPFNAVIRLTMFAGALSTVLFPRLASVAAGGDLVRARDLVRRATRLSVASMSLMLAPLVAVAPELLRVWLGPTFAERSSRPMRILLVALVANTAAYAYNSAIRARARPSALTWLYAAELPLHLAAVYLLVRAWGTTGAALAWAARATVDLAGHYLIAGRTLGERAGGAASLGGPMAALGAFAFACEALGPAMPLGLRVMIGVLLGLGTASLVLTAEDRTVALQALGPLSRRRGEGA
jgi:O-antigen/teichoic acid export membrane protein